MSMASTFLRAMSKKQENLPNLGWRAASPYNELPPLPPSVDLESKSILKACITARVAVAELKQAAELIPNQAILINTLPLLEARSSSEIENIITTTDRLFRYREENEEQADSATKEALRYGHALLEGYGALLEKPICTNLAEQICTRIKGVEMAVRKGPGTALANGKTGEVVYTPPVGEDLLRRLLANWERFLHEHTDIDPLIRLAVGHYQFEAIHPFTDGNGRTGRVINSLFLIQENLLTLPILYHSRHILREKSDYYRLLRRVTSDGDWEAWVLYILRGVEETAAWTTGKIAAIRALAEHTREHVRTALPKIYTHELVELIFERPYCRIRDLETAGLAKRQTASIYLKELATIGVLRETQVGNEKLFIHPKFLDLLTTDGNDFAPYAAACGNESVRISE